MKDILYEISYHYHRLLEIPHKIENRYLRLVRGIGCCDVYGLDHYLTPIILRSLIVYRNSLVKYPSYPANLKSIQEWEDILAKMVLAFEILKNDGQDETPEQTEQIKKGLRLFSEYYRNLWL